MNDDKTPLCRQPLIGLGTPCGRPVDVAAGVGRCAFHSLEVAHFSRPMQRRLERAAHGESLECENCESTQIYAKGLCRRCYKREYMRFYQRERRAAQRMAERQL